MQAPSPLKDWKLRLLVEHAESHQTWICNTSARPGDYLARILTVPSRENFEYFERHVNISQMLNPLSARFPKASSRDLPPLSRGSSEFVPLAYYDLEAPQAVQIYPRLSMPSLESWYRAQTQMIPVGFQVQMACELLRALSALHRLGFVHGNVSSQTVLFDDRVGVRLVGLGHCEKVGDWVTCFRQANRYTPPEVQTGRFEASSAQDVYSAGMVIADLWGHEFLTTQIAREMLSPDPEMRPTARELLPLFVDLGSRLSRDYPRRAC